MTQHLYGLIPALVLLPLAESAPATSLWDVAEKYGIWAAIALTLGYLLVQDKRALVREVREIRDYQTGTLEGLVRETKLAIERNTERMVHCPQNRAEEGVMIAALLLLLALRADPSLYELYNEEAHKAGLKLSSEIMAARQVSQRVVFQDPDGAGEIEVVFRRPVDPAAELLKRAQGSIDQLLRVGRDWLDARKLPPSPDLDRDGDVDLDDFGIVQRCFGGANLPPPAGCR